MSGRSGPAAGGAVNDHLNPLDAGQPRFTLRQLQLFVAACDTGSITQAAQVENLTQSAVSAAIAQLERSLDVKLLIRHHAQGVAPTVEGRRFLAEARVLLRQASSLDRRVGAQGVTGQVDVGVLEILAPFVLPRMLAEFSETHPEVSLRFRELDTPNLQRELRDGLVSVGVCNSFGIWAEVDYEPLVDLHPFVLLAADHPDANRRWFEVGDLDGMPFIRQDRVNLVDYQREIFATAGIEPRVVASSANASLVRGLVANGHGYSIFNSPSVIRPAPDGRPLVGIPLKGDLPTFSYGLARWGGITDTPPVEAFSNYVREAFTTGDQLGFAPLRCPPD